MAPAEHENEADNARIMLGLLESVERGGATSQRTLADELGIALGLVNAYLKRCVKKGLVKVRQAPARRYAYYLTPHGFAEKSRLTVEFLSSSFGFFRQAKADCSAALRAAARRGLGRIALAGISDLAEIAMICAPECGVKITAVVDRKSAHTQFVGVPVVTSFDAIEGEFDGVLVTDLLCSRETFEAAAARVGADRVLAPRLLGVRPRVAEETPQ
jgi:DNA-binding MarR family transcriptional regulator